MVTHKFATMLLILSSLLSTSPSPPLPLIECDVPRVDNFPPYYCFVPLARGELGLIHTIDHTHYTEGLLYTAKFSLHLHTTHNRPYTEGVLDTAKFRLHLHTTHNRKPYAKFVVQTVFIP